MDHPVSFTIVIKIVTKMNSHFLENNNKWLIFNNIIILLKIIYFRKVLNQEPKVKKKFHFNNKVKQFRLYLIKIKKKMLYVKQIK